MNTDGEEVKVNGLGRIYNRIVNFSVVTRYLVYVLPIAILLAVPIVLYAVLKPKAFFATTGIKVYLFWSWIEVSLLFLGGGGGDEGGLGGICSRPVIALHLRYGSKNGKY